MDTGKLMVSVTETAQELADLEHMRERLEAQLAQLFVQGKQASIPVSEMARAANMRRERVHYAIVRTLAERAEHEGGK